MRRCCLAIALLIVILFTSASALCSGIDREMRAGDKRFEKPVTLSTKNIYLGELLQRLQEQTGVTLQMDPREPASGLELMARFEKVPLGDVLDSLYALLSCQHGEWNWRKSANSVPVVYTLIETRQAKLRFEQAQALGQKALEDSVALMSRLAEMKPEERRKHRQEVARIYEETNPEILDEMFTGSDAAYWDQFLFFSRALTPEQQAQVLRGQTQVEVQVNNLAPEVKTPLTALYRFQFPSGEINGMPVSPPLPDSILLYTTRGRPGSRDLSPVVYMQIGEKGSLSVLESGLLTLNFRSILWRAWILPGDKTEDLSAQKTISEEIEKDPEPLPSFVSRNDKVVDTPPSGLLRRRLFQTAQGASLPLLALLPAPQPSKNSSSQNFSSVINKKVQEPLDRLKFADGKPFYKWRSGFLLINYPSYFVEEDDTIPYEVWGLWRHCKDELMGAKELARFMVHLNDAQFTQLKLSYPFFNNVTSLRPLFFYAKEHPEILGKEGAILDEQINRELLNYPLFNTNPDFRSGKITAMRFTEETTLSNGRKVQLVHLEGLRDHTEWVKLRLFTMEASSVNK